VTPIIEAAILIRLCCVMGRSMVNLEIL